MNDIYTVQPKPNAKTLIAYHANCMDGFTAAYVTCQAIIEKGRKSTEVIDMLPVEYGKLSPLFIALAETDYTRLYVVDFSLPINLLEDIATNFPDTNTVILDHHKSASCMYGDYKLIYGALIVIDVLESGATLAWKHFQGNAAMPKLLSYVRDYDLWKFDYPGTKAVNMYLRTLDKTIPDWEQAEKDLEDSEAHDKIINSAMMTLRYSGIIVADIVKGAVPIDLAGKQGLSANCPPEFASAVGNELAIVSGTFGAAWHQVGNEVKFSLRSQGNYDVAELAEKFGGGGHLHASGFKLSTPQDETVGAKAWNIKE